MKYYAKVASYNKESERIEETHLFDSQTDRENFLVSNYVTVLELGTVSYKRY